MIFVTLGTQDKEFKRLLVELDKLIVDKVINEKVIVQAGTTKYVSKNMDIFDFISMKEFDGYVDKCDLLITHGGVGSILGAICKEKRVFAVARLKDYEEHENDHQVQIVSKFDDFGYIVGCLDATDISNKFKRLDNFKPCKYQSNSDKFCLLLQNLIDE